MVISFSRKKKLRELLYTPLADTLLEKIPAVALITTISIRLQRRCYGFSFGINPGSYLEGGGGGNGGLLARPVNFIMLISYYCTIIGK